MYWYGLNNPTNNVDPNGLWVVGGGFGGAGGHGVGDSNSPFGAASSGAFFGSSKCGGVGAGLFSSTTSGRAIGLFGNLSFNILIGFGDIEDVGGDFSVTGGAFPRGRVDIIFRDGKISGVNIAPGLLPIPGFGGFFGKGDTKATSTSNCGCP